VDPEEVQVGSGEPSKVQSATEFVICLCKFSVTSYTTHILPSIEMAMDPKRGSVCFIGRKQAACCL
jgi:hypothetical protein